MRRALLPLLLAVPALSPAHFLWATLGPGEKAVAIGLQEVPTDAPLPLGERAAKVGAWDGAKRRLKLAPEGSWLKAPVAADVVGTQLEYGVLDRRGEGRGLFRLRYFAKAATTPAASRTLVGLPVEVTARRDGDTGAWLVTVLREGKPAPGAKVTVEGAFEGETGPDGTATVPASPRLAVRALVTDATKGKGYDLTRSYSTLTVGGRGEAEPFTKTLSNAFGDAHDVVSRSPFIETVLAKKLTKEQLAVHLQQRALVHAALDRVLSAAKDLPYGPEQRAVLRLIREDLTAMGAGEAPARPLTAAFLKEIEAGGPGFALGAFHVYYGGITNGGRFIGKTMGEATGFTPTYYEKSDGYRPYLAEVNRIADPALRAEIVRGGLAAYRFIVATNGEDFVRSE